MLKVGGIIAIDDVGMKSINKLMRYIMKYPCYELVGNVELKLSPQRAWFNRLVRPPFHAVSKLLPKKLKHEVFSGRIINSDNSLRLKSSMIALRKTKEDERPWNWFKDF